MIPSAKVSGSRPETECGVETELGQEGRNSLNLGVAPGRLQKVLSDVTYRIEEETRRPGRRCHRRVVHFNCLKPRHSLPQEALSPMASSRQAENLYLLTTHLTLQ